MIIIVVRVLFCKLDLYIKYFMERKLKIFILLFFIRFFLYILKIEKYFVFKYIYELILNLEKMKLI